jgi:hypothetical protein
MISSPFKVENLFPGGIVRGVSNREGWDFKTDNLAENKALEGIAQSLVTFGNGFIKQGRFGFCHKGAQKTDPGLLAP